MRIFPALAVCALTALPLAGCDRAEVAGRVAVGGSGDVRHPTRENLPSGSALAALIPAKDGEPELRSLAGRLARAEPLIALGAAEGTPAEVFGVVEDIAPGPDGRFWVLDSRYNNVREFSADGRLLRTVSGPGRGPDELMAPEAVERDGAGRLIVADRHNRLKIFADAGGEFHAVETVSVRFVPEDFCLLDDRIFVQAATDAAVVHGFDLSGQPSASFAEAYRSPNALVRNQLSDGPIGCSEDAGIVAFMPKYLPVVRAYGPDGQARWTSRIENFRPMVMTEGVDEKGQPFLDFSPPSDGFHFGSGITALPGGVLLVQVGLHTPESLRERSEHAELHSYLVHAATGRGTYAGARLPRIVAASSDRLYAAVSDPVPQAVVYRY